MITKLVHNSSLEVKKECYKYYFELLKCLPPSIPLIIKELFEIKMIMNRRSYKIGRNIFVTMNSMKIAKKKCL